MLDRVREALFSTLAPEIGDARVLDLFAGTGSLGLEALSRGAARARLVERAQPVLRVLRANVETLGVGDRAEVVGADALDERVWGAPGERWDVAFLDPPYALVADGKGRALVFRALERLVGGVLEEDGVAVLHVERRALDERAFPAAVDASRRDYGSSSLWYARSAGR